MAAIPVRELVTIWGFDIKDKPLQKMEKGIKNIKSSLLVVGTIASAAAATLFGVAKSVANQGENAAKAAAETGVHVETLQELTFAAEQNKITQQELVGVLKDLSNRTFDVIEGNQKQALAFRRLGVQVANSAGDLRDADEVLLDLADSFKRLPDGAEKTVLATQALGSAGAKLIPFLNRGSAGINELRKEARRLGVVLGEDTVRAAALFQENLRKAMGAVTGIKNAIGAELLPVISEMLAEFREFVVVNRKLITTKVKQFIEALKFALEVMLIVLNNSLKVWNAFITLLGGGENALKAITVAMGIFLGGKILAGLGLLVLGMKALVTTFIAGEAAAIGFDIAALLIPIAIGAVIAALALLVEDMVAFTGGRDSIIGRAIRVLREDFPKAFEVLKATFKLMSAIVSQQAALWGGFLDGIIQGFKDIVSFVTDKVVPLIKNLFKDTFIGDLFTKFANSQSLVNLINKGTENIRAGEADIRGRSEPPRQLSPAGSGVLARGGGNTFESNFNINADSLTKEEATTAVESGVERAMGGIFRQAERDVNPAVER